MIPKIASQMLTVNEGSALLAKVKDAVPELKDRMVDFKELERGIPATDISRWTSEIEAWEEDANNPNPFEPRDKGSCDLFNQLVQQLMCGKRSYSAGCST